MQITKVKWLVLVGLSIWGMAAVALSDDELRRGLLLRFFGDTEMDCLVNGRSPLDGVSFETRYGRFIQVSGWGRERFFRELNALVSNGCSRVGAATNYSYSAGLELGPFTIDIDSLMMGIAVEGLCSAESNEWITCAGWLLTNGVDECALPIGELYVKKYGVTAQTLENCRRAIAANPGITKKKAAGLMVAVDRAIGNSVSTSVSNAMVRLVLAEAAKDNSCYVVRDHLLCKFWQGYSVSSNRYQYIQMARDDQDYVTDRPWHDYCNGYLRELEKHQPLPLLPTNTINGVTW